MSLDKITSRERSAAPSKPKPKPNASISLFHHHSTDHVPLFDMALPLMSFVMPVPTLVFDMIDCTRWVVKMLLLLPAMMLSLRA